MKYFAQIFFLFLIHNNNIYGQVSRMAEIDYFGNNPGNLKMFLHTKVANDTTKVPLVIVLHGCGENAKSVSELTGWNKLADLNNFVVLYPQQKFFNNPNLCFNWFNNDDIEKGKGECESIFQMISFAGSEYNIDSNKIYITGLSAGAAMSVVMTATHPEMFRCGAIFAGGAYGIATGAIDGLKAMLGKKEITNEQLVANVKNQNPNYEGPYPTLIIYQGLNDPIVNYKSAALIVNQWTGINNTDSFPDKVEPSYKGIEDICRKEYADSLGKTVVIFYEVNNLGHRLMIRPGEQESEGGRIGLFGVNKGFHSTYQTALDFGIIKKND